MSDDEAVTGPVTGTEPDIRPAPYPNGARLAVNFQVALEAWSGTSVTGSILGAKVASDSTEEAPDWATISGPDYGGRTGAWRLLRIFEEEDTAAAWSLNGLVAERWPELTKAIVVGGHEIIGHGYSQDRPMHKMGREEDLDTVRRTTEVIEQVTGQRPVGWSSHASRRGNFTVESLLKTGYVYTNDFRDADLPYIVAEMGSRRLVAMPRNDEINDMFNVYLHGNSPAVLVDYFKRACDQVFAEGDRHPGVVTCVVHATLTGRPWGASALRECLRYAKSYPEAWVCRRREVAEHFLSAVRSNGG